MVDSVSMGNELFKESEHRGVTIRSMRGLEGAGLSLAYAIADDWLLLSMGKARYLNQLINQMNKGKNSLWESAFIQNALDDLPRGIRQVDYVDFSKMFSFFQVMFEAIDENDFAISPEDFGEFPYFLLGWSKDTDNGFISKAKLYPLPSEFLLFKKIGFSFAFLTKPSSSRFEANTISNPEVQLTGWNARCLNHADLNGDGWKIWFISIWISLIWKFSTVPKIISCRKR